MRMHHALGLAAGSRGKHQQERIIRGRLPTMEVVNERFARNIRVGLFNLMRKSPEVTTGTIICTSSTRPASPFEGQTIYETDTDKELTWSGSAWVVTNRPLTPWPSFDVSRSSTQSTTGVVIFQDVTHNTGSHYNTSTGKFTAPVDGI